MRILFAGTPEIAVPSLEAAAAHFDTAAVLTNPDRMKGRGRRVISPPVKTEAERLGIPVLQFTSLKREAREAVAAVQPDLLVVFAYGHIFGPKFLSLFPFGGINVHPSLLPKYRGPSPIPAALLAGDELSGVSIQKLALEMDTGDILMQHPMKISSRDTAETVSTAASRLAAEMLVDVIFKIENGTAKSVPQDSSRASYCGKIAKDDGRIDWIRDTAVQADRKIRAYYPWPKAFTFYNGKRLMITDAVPVAAENLKIADHSLPGKSGDTGARGNPAPGTITGADRENDGLQIICRDGALAVRRMQLEGRKETDWKSFLNGHAQCIGTRLAD